MPPPPVTHSRLRKDPKAHAYMYSWCRSDRAIKWGDPGEEEAKLVAIVARLYPELFILQAAQA